MKTSKVNNTFIHLTTTVSYKTMKHYNYNLFFPKQTFQPPSFQLLQQLTRTGYLGLRELLEIPDRPVGNHQFPTLFARRQQTQTRNRIFLTRVLWARVKQLNQVRDTLFVLPNHPTVMLNRHQTRNGLSRHLTHIIRLSFK